MSKVENLGKTIETTATSESWIDGDLPVNEIKTALQTIKRFKSEEPKGSDQPRVDIKLSGGIGSGQKSAKKVENIELDDRKGAIIGPNLSDTNKNVKSEKEDGIEGLTGSSKSIVHIRPSQGKKIDERTQFIVQWLKETFQEVSNTSLPRSSVFEQYEGACKSNGITSVNSATFGKIIRAVFPRMKTRRLGSRGDSKYHYFGIAPINDGILAQNAGRKSRTIPKRRKSINLSVKDESEDYSENQQAPKSTIIVKQQFPYHPLIPDFEEFSKFVIQICQPTLDKTPSEIGLETMSRFSCLYHGHMCHLLRLISSRDFQLVEMAIGVFWNSFPKDLYPCINSIGGVRIMSIADDYLFQVAIHILVPDTLDPLPLPMAQAIRYFAKSLEINIIHIFEAALPRTLAACKFDTVRRFCQVLRRKTSLNHLAQAVTAILSSQEHLKAMLQDFLLIDGSSVREHMTILNGITQPGDIENLIEHSETAFKNFLMESAPLKHWVQWLEGMIEQNLALEIGLGKALEETSCHFALKWCYFTSSIMREMTLRSASSFGSYHLLRLMLDEYAIFYIEKKIDENRRAIGLLSFWPVQADSEGHLTTHANYESTLAGFASMDELFRKSGFLAYSQPVTEWGGNNRPS